MNNTSSNIKTNMFSRIPYCFLDVSTANMKLTLLAVFSLFPQLRASDPNMEDFLNISTVEEKQSKWEEFETKISQLESEIFYLKSKGNIEAESASSC